MPKITHIERITDAENDGWKYTVDIDDQPLDYWLDGVLIAEALTGDTFEIYALTETPPEVEVCAHGGRVTQSYANRRIAIQWFVDSNTSFAIQEYVSGELANTIFVDVPFPERYHTVHIPVAATSNVERTFAVVAAELHEPDRYSLSGLPVETVIYSYYLPIAPDVVYTFNNTSRVLTIS